MIRRNILTDSGVAQQYIAAVRNLKDPAISPWPGQNELSMYDFFVFWHHRAMMFFTPPSQNSRNAAHEGPSFLPWHRYMLLMFEFNLRTVINDDAFRLPYWDWAADSALSNPAGSALWSDSLLGQFERPEWRVRLGPNPRQRNPRVIDRPLRRAIGSSPNGRLGRRDELRALVRDELIYDTPGYDRVSGGLRNRLEGWIGVGLHNLVHVWIGGDMEESTSPNDPVFFLHHANVDRIWGAWQARHLDSPYQPGAAAPNEYRFHRQDDAMHTFFNHGFDVTPELMLDSSAYYRYDTLADLN